MVKSDKTPLKNQMDELIGNLEIRGVQLVTSSFGIAVPPEFLAPERVRFNLSTEFNADVNRAVDGLASEILCFILATVVGSVTEEDPLYSHLPNNGSIINGSCSFVVRYSLKEPKCVADELAMELARTQAFFNAFPYVRNYIDSQFMQMGVSGLILPLAKKQPVKSEPKVSAQV